MVAIASINSSKNYLMRESGKTDLLLSLFHDDLLTILDIESAMQMVCLCTLQGVDGLMVLVLSGNGVDTGFPMR